VEVGWAVAVSRPRGHNAGWAPDWPERRSTAATGEIGHYRLERPRIKLPCSSKSCL